MLIFDIFAPGSPVQPSEGDGDEPSESESGRRTRRLLPRVPPEKGDGAPPGLPGRRDSSKERDRADAAPRDSARCLSLPDEVDPDSLSDASRSEDGAVSRRAKSRRAAPSSSSAKCTLFYIGSDESGAQPDPARFSAHFQRSPDPPAKTPPTTVLIRQLGGHEARRGGVKANSSAPDLPTQNADCVPTRDASSLVRRDVPAKRLPHISSQPNIRDSEGRTERFPDAEPFLREPGGFPSPGSHKGGDSLSGESDVDTASTVSQLSGKRTPVAKGPDGGLRKERASSAQQKGRQPSARERLSEKRRSQPPAAPAHKAEAAKRVQMRRSAGARGSLDLPSEGRQSSDQEASRASGRAQKAASLQKDDGGGAKAAHAQLLPRSNSLSAPRPTRASMLRRARLGDASDNEGADTDRASQSSEHATPAPKAAPEAKKLSRLDILALPRKRTASFTGDGETTPSAGRSAFSARNLDALPTARKSSASDARQAACRAGKNPRSRTRSTAAKYPNGGEFAAASRTLFAVLLLSPNRPICVAPACLPGAFLQRLAHFLVCFFVIFFVACQNLSCQRGDGTNASPRSR